MQKNKIWYKKAARLTASLVFFLSLSPRVVQANVDTFFLQARDAFRNADASGFERNAAQIPSEYPMVAYLDFWRYKLKQPNQVLIANPEQETIMEMLLNRHASSWAAEQFRREYVLSLAKKGDWPRFKTQIALLNQKDDLSTQCLETYTDHLDDKDISQALNTYLQWPKEFPEGCAWMAEQLHQNGRIKHKDVMRRIQVLVENGNLTNATRVYSYLHNNGGKERGTDPKVFEQAIEKPSRFLLSLGSAINPNKADLAVLAISKYSRDNPEEAAQWLEQNKHLIPTEQRSWAWSQIGLFAAKKWHPQATEWFNAGQAEQRSKEAHEWLARMNLLRKNWADVQRTILAMPESLQSENTWRFWLAKSKQMLGEPENATQLYRTISSPFHFYGQLATEELGQAIVFPPSAAQSLTAAELSQIAQHPGLQRALIWYRLNQRTEGFREFNHALTGMTDRQLLAAAIWAKNNELPDRAIAAADRTKNQHDLSLRYLTPFRESLTQQTNQSSIDIAWVYGLIRQESRFITAAKSTVGASGLMQLMPGTAKMMAQKIGMGNQFTQNQINNIELNLRLGTTYLKMLSDQFENSLVLATAGYNAGPGRPKQWRSKLPLKSIEGEIFAEAIPFTETRDYVKKVSANTIAYAYLFDQRPQSLKARLGKINFSVGANLPFEREFSQNVTMP